MPHKLKKNKPIESLEQFRVCLMNNEKIIFNRTIYSPKYFKDWSTAYIENCIRLKRLWTVI